METTKELHLELTDADLSKQLRGKPLPAPRFFHFTKTAKEFQDATLITFKDFKGNEFIIKDIYSRKLRKNA